MVEPGENVSETLRKEFTEEALAKLEMRKEKRDQLSRRINQLFANGVEVGNKNKSLMFLFIFIQLKVH